MRTFLILATGAMLLAFCVGATPSKAEPNRTAPGPSLKIDAPARAQVGQPIKIKLAVKGATDIGGYETNLLFDTGAAQFSSPYQQEGDLGDSERGVESLGPVELAQGGVAIGAFSCPVEDCVKPGRGTARAKRGGVGGTVRLTTLTVVPNRPGKLEFELGAMKVVDAAGEPVGIGLRDEKFAVRVGPKGARTLYAAPNAKPRPSQSGSSSGRQGLSDLTGDGEVTHADVMEAAVDWTALRESGAACGDDLADPSRDVNGDGCVDVADLQTVAADYGTDDTGGLRSAATNATATTTVASTFTVDSTGDSADASAGDGVCATAQNVCTLRAAIEEANLHRGPDTVAFGIPGTGVQTINIGSTLPKLNDRSGPTTIDGYTQPGSLPNTDPLASNAAIKVQITTPTKYAAGINGLTVTSPGNTIRGLSIFGIRKNVWLFGGGALNNTIAGNFIGTNAAGNYFATVYNKQGEGVAVQGGASFNDVGVASLEGRNVVSGNARRGVSLFPTGSNSNRVMNNIVGLGPGGDTRVPNWKIGIDINIDAANNQVGGAGQYERNVVSGSGQLGSNRGQGIELSHGPAVTGNRVEGNLFGTDLTGNSGPVYAHLPGGAVNFEDRTGINNVVDDNVIGNSRVGVRIMSAGDQQIENNRIGVSLDGSPIPNEDYGVQIGAVGGNLNPAAGSRVGPGNIITNSGESGVSVESASSDRNTITRNSIFGNAGLGIDLEPLGAVNPNDAGDADSGANEQLNFPVIQRATPTLVSGKACGGCTVEVFLADGGGSAYGEGRTFLGSTTANADGTFTVAVSGVAAGDYVTATATDGVGNTSEFSLNRAVSDDTIAPAAPTGLTATYSQSGGNIALDWADNTESDLEGYGVYRSTTAGGPYRNLTSSSGSSSSYTDPSVVRGRTYHYVVTATDEAGNESGFSDSASATVPSGALSFDGVNDRVLIPDSNLLNGAFSTERTYEVRIKTGSDVGSRQILYEEGGDGRGFSIEIQGGRIYFNAWAVSDGWNPVSASAAVDPNTIYSVAGVYHQPSGEVRLFLDGVLQSISTGAGSMKAHGDDVALGGVAGSTRDHTNTLVRSDSYFGGLTDEFRAWNYARTQAQLQGDMDADLTGNESGLIVLYEIDEGSGTILDDATPNNLDGTINGPTWTAFP